MKLVTPMTDRMVIHFLKLWKSATFENDDGGSGSSFGDSSHLLSTRCCPDIVL